ncbi:MAG: hypothetical protein ACYCQI_14770 [Gammaproteobacteria bacterium]
MSSSSLVIDTPKNSALDWKPTLDELRAFIFSHIKSRIMSKVLSYREPEVDKLRIRCGSISASDVTLTELSPPPENLKYSRTEKNLQQTKRTILLSTRSGVAIAVYDISYITGMGCDTGKTLDDWLDGSVYGEHATAKDIAHIMLSYYACINTIHFKILDILSDAKLIPDEWHAAIVELHKLKLYFERSLSTLTSCIENGDGEQAFFTIKSTEETLKSIYNSLEHLRILITRRKQEAKKSAATSSDAGALPKPGTPTTIQKIKILLKDKTGGMAYYLKKYDVQLNLKDLEQTIAEIREKIKSANNAEEATQFELLQAKLRQLLLKSKSPQSIETAGLLSTPLVTPPESPRKTPLPVAAELPIQEMKTQNISNSPAAQTQKEPNAEQKTFATSTPEHLRRNIVNTQSKFLSTLKSILDIISQKELVDWEKQKSPICNKMKELVESLFKINDRTDDAYLQSCDRLLEIAYQIQEPVKTESLKLALSLAKAIYSLELLKRTISNFTSPGEELKIPAHFPLESDPLTTTQWADLTSSAVAIILGDKHEAELKKQKEEEEQRQKELAAEIQAKAKAVELPPVLSINSPSRARGSSAISDHPVLNQQPLPLLPQPKTQSRWQRFATNHPYIATGLQLTGYILGGLAIGAIAGTVAYFAWPAVAVAGAVNVILGNTIIGGILGAIGGGLKKLFYDKKTSNIPAPIALPLDDNPDLEISSPASALKKTSSYQPKPLSSHAKTIMTPSRDRPGNLFELKNPAKPDSVITIKEVDIYNGIKALIYPDDEHERVKILNFWSHIRTSSPTTPITVNDVEYRIPSNLAKMIEHIQEGAPAGIGNTLDLYRNTILDGKTKVTGSKLALRGSSKLVDFELSLYNLIKNPDKIAKKAQLNGLEELLNKIKKSDIYCMEYSVARASPQSKYSRRN